MPEWSCRTTAQMDHKTWAEVWGASPGPAEDAAERTLTTETPITIWTVTNHAVWGTGALPHGNNPSNLFRFNECSVSVHATVAQRSWGTERTCIEQTLTHSTQRERNMISPLFEHLSFIIESKDSLHLTPDTPVLDFSSCTSEYLVVLLEVGSVTSIFCHLRDIMWLNSLLTGRMESNLIMDN